MTTIVAPPSNASKWQMGFNSVFKGLIYVISVCVRIMWNIHTRYLEKIKIFEDIANYKKRCDIFKICIYPTLHVFVWLLPSKTIICPYSIN
jgi:hypothetical protein